MTKTQTTRFGQTQYSSGGDSFLRADVNSDATDLEARAAYDDGAAYSVLPSVGGIIAGRYVMYAPAASPYRTLYRATGTSGTWAQAIGNSVPEPLTYRPYASGDQPVTAAAATFTHPNLSTPAATVSYGGDASLAGATVYDRNDATSGALHVGADLAESPATLGRAHVRTRLDGDRGLVLQPHGTGAGNMLTAREPGGADVTTLDASGYLRARALSGFGGGAISSGNAVVAAPTSNATDGVNNGMLLHGQSGAGSKTILALQRDAADTAPIGSVARDAIALGRLPWGDATSGGTVSLAGRQIKMRGLGYTGDTALWSLSAAADAAPADTAQDALVTRYGRTAATIRTPLSVTQELATTGANLTLDRYTDYTGRFLTARRIGGDGSTETIVGLEADGRLSLGARWQGAGVLYDARNTIRHVSTRRWAQPQTDGPTSGVAIQPNATFTYTFSTMTCRSTQRTDLNAHLNMEYTASTGAPQTDLNFFLDSYLSINGGAWSFIATTEHFGYSVPPGQREAGTTSTADVRWLGVPAGATFQLRFIVRSGSTLVPVLFLRMFDLNVEENVIAAYTAP